MPDFAYEAAHSGYVAGLDEAGRGPLAGPVVAAALILRPNDIPDGLDDSKALSPKQRERILNILMKCAFIGIGISEPQEIDRVNILAASIIAMQRAYAALPVQANAALIDGTHCPNLPCQTESIIKGDSKSLSIAGASIIAKVTRDNLMRQADKLYPAYGFARHKGYATAAHRDALKAYGPCPIHRYSYKPVQMAMSNHNI